MSTSLDADVLAPQAAVLLAAPSEGADITPSITWIAHLADPSICAAWLSTQCPLGQVGGVWCSEYELPFHHQLHRAVQATQSEKVLLLRAC